MLIANVTNSLPAVKIAEYKFNNTLQDLIPTFNGGFEYTYEDIVEGNVTTRTIYSEELPTLMKFGTSGNDGSSNKTKSLLEIIYLDTSNLNTMEGMFAWCENVTAINTTNWDTKNVTNMCDMFCYCKALLKIIGINNWDTSNVESFNNGNYGMFEGCEKLIELDLSNWDVSKENCMEYMFHGCKALKKIKLDNWDVSNVDVMNYMFYNTSSLSRLTMNNWSINNAVSTASMFSQSKVMYVQMLNSSYNFVNKIITGLPTKATYSHGKLEIFGIDDISQVDTVTAETKYWDITNKSYDYKLITYKYDNTISYDYLPNVYSNHICEDVVDGNITTRTLYGNSEFSFDFEDDISALLEVTYLNGELGMYSEMFMGCTSLIKMADLSNFGAINGIGNSYCMLNYCTNLSNEVLNINNWYLDGSDYTWLITDTLIKKINMNNWSFDSDDKYFEQFINSNTLLEEVNMEEWDVSQVTYFGFSRAFEDCTSLKKVNMKGLKFGDSENIHLKDNNNRTPFIGCTALVYINLQDADTSAVNKMISVLPSRVDKEVGTVVVSDIEIVSNESKTLLITLNWNIVEETKINKIAEYKFDNSLYDLFPSFNSGYSYDYTDKVEGNITIRTITSENLPTTIRFGASGSATNRERSLLEVLEIDMSNVTTMQRMFQNCSSLTQLDASNWNIAKVSNMQYLFYNCSSLTQLDLSNWNTSNVANMNNAFGGCTNLSSITMKNSDYNSINKVITALISRTANSPGTLDIIGVDNINQVNTSTASSKYWNVKTSISILIARYTANASGVVPTFNSGYQYTVNETNSNGIYTVELRSDTDFTSCSFYGKTKLLTVEYLKVTNNVTTLTNNDVGMFEGCTSLTTINMSDWDTSNVTNMNYPFYNCSQLTQLDLSNWNTSNVTSMLSMFYGCKSLTSLDVSNWDTSNVTNMNYMFYDCESLTSLDVSNWDTSNVATMNYTFYNCNQLTQLDLNNWNTSNVTSMLSMFYDCESLTSLDISNWDTSNVTNMSYTFYYCLSLNNIIATNVSTSTLSTLVTALSPRTSDSYGTIKTTNTTDGITSYANTKYWNIEVPMLIARYTANASGVVPTFNEGYQYTVNETNSNGIYTVEINADTDFTSCNFSGRNKLLTVEYLKVTNNVTTLTNNDVGMFEGCTSLTTINMSDWDTSNIATMKYTFYNCSQLTQLDLSNWNTSNVTSMLSMFYYCESLTSLDVSNWDTSNVTNMNYMFYDCNQLTQLDLNNWNTSNVTSILSMFYDCESLTSLDVSNWDTSNVTNMNYTFYNCNQLTQLDLSNWNTSNVISMVSMFYDCNNLTSLDVSNWDTSNVTTMNYMFYDCLSLTSLDVSNFDTSNVTTMKYMFYDCNNLTSLDVSNWDTSNVTTMDGMFQNCNKLNAIGMIYCDIDSVSIIANLLPYTEGLIRTIYIQDVSAEQCTPVQGVEFKEYKACNQIIQIPIQLVGGAELYWDEELKVYCIKDFSNNIIQTDITNPITLNTYNPYYKISIDGNEPINIKANIAMKKK